MSPDKDGKVKGIGGLPEIPWHKEVKGLKNIVEGAESPFKGIDETRVYQPDKSEPIYRRGTPLISTYEKEIAKLKSLLSLAYTHIPTKPGTRLVKDEIREVLRG